MDDHLDTVDTPALLIGDAVKMVIGNSWTRSLQRFLLSAWDWLFRRRAKRPTAYEELLSISLYW